jgi:large subunit ribosomal protein L1
MGKKRTAVVSDTTESKAKKSIFKWEEAYTDLPVDIANVLKDSRVKPEQLVAMADGEILALAGMNPQFLEKIRASYPAQLVEVNKEVEQPVAKEAAKPVEEKKPTSTSPKTKRPRFRFGRSATYKSKITKVEDKAYDLEAAIELLKTISYSAHKIVELHLNVIDTGLRGEISLPFSIGKDIKVVIFSDAVAEEVKNGKINFDILLALPADMPKIAPLAKVLGPRGLMPNPKNGTITPDPEARAKQLTAGATLAYKTEPKAPVMHLVVGNLNQKNQEIVDNLKAIISGIGISKIRNATLKSTMSPGIRLLIA